MDREKQKEGIQPLCPAEMARGLAGAAQAPALSSAHRSSDPEGSLPSAQEGLCTQEGLTPSLPISHGLSGSFQHSLPGTGSTKPRIALCSWAPGVGQQPPSSSGLALRS